MHMKEVLWPWVDYFMIRFEFWFSSFSGVIGEDRKYLDSRLGVSLLCRVLLVRPSLTRFNSSDSGAYGREISTRVKSRSSSSSRILEPTVCIRCISSSISLLIPWHYELDSSSLAS